MFKFCAGLDVHKRMIVACALVSSAEGPPTSDPVHLPQRLWRVWRRGCLVDEVGCHPDVAMDSMGVTGSRCSMSWRRF